MLKVEVKDEVEFVRRPTTMIMQRVTYYIGKEYKYTLVLDGSLHPITPRDCKGLANQGGVTGFLTLLCHNRGVGPYFYKEEEVYIYPTDQEPSGGKVFHFEGVCLSTVAPTLKD